MLMRACLLLAVTGCFIKPDPPGTSSSAQPIASRLAAGPRHACWIDDAGTLRCWGDNRDGQLGRQTGALAAKAGIVGDPTDVWTWVAAGDAHTCGIRDHRLFCWGRGTDGQVDGTQSGTRLGFTEVMLPGDAPPARVFAGSIGSCAIDEAGKAFCWGGFGGSSSALQSIDPGGGGDGDLWSQIAFGGDHDCALATSGDVFCWGIGGNDELGANDVGQNHAVAIQDAVHQYGAQFVSVAASTAGTCAITVDGDLACWGAPAYTTRDYAPYEEVSTRSWSAVSVAPYWVCGVREGGVRCYGENGNGALGNTFDNRDAPPSTSLLDGAVEIATGDDFACARTQDNQVQCWGSSQYGQLGNGEVATQHTPFRVLGGPIATLAAGIAHTCAVTNDGRTYCFGDNRGHQIAGDPAMTFYEQPQLLGVPTMSALAAGGRHTCGIEESSPATIDCWGDDAAGLQATKSASEADAGATAWGSLVAADDKTCAVTGTGKLLCWGGGPKIASPDTWTRIGLRQSGDDMLFVGAKHDSANNTDLLVILGADCSGTVASYTPTYRTPVSATIAQLTVAAGDAHACVLEQTGPNAIVKCWGHDHVGQVGVGPMSCVPATGIVDVPLGGGWIQTESSIAAGGFHTCGIAASGKLYCWGTNDDAAIGDKIAADTATPQIATGMTWSRIVTGPHHACGIEAASQDLYCWGLNRFGEVGNGLRFRETPQGVMTE